MISFGIADLPENLISSQISGRVNSKAREERNGCFWPGQDMPVEFHLRQTNTDDNIADLAGKKNTQKPLVLILGLALK
jgi:hypothetical protein